MSDLTKRLAAPFPPHLVSFRVGPTTQDKTKGMALAYIDARDVMYRLDEVCGPENWQDEYPWSDGRRVVCRIGIKIGDEWIWKTDGAGDTETEGEKGALSDAFKRSAVKWGVGRYLYDVDAPWVAIKQAGKSYVIAESEYGRLRNMLPAPKGTNAPKPVEAPEADPFVPEHPPERPTAKPRADHPRRQEALDAYGRIKKAIDAQQGPGQIDALVKAATSNGDLALIKEVHSETYDLLMNLAQARKDELRAAA